eukprot:gene631-1222_t
MADKQLLARIHKENKLRAYSESVREYESATSKATWEQSLAFKDRLANQKRNEAAIKEESKYSDAAIKQSRKEKISALYRRDEAQYEQELEGLGLTFRKERL